MTGSAGRNSAPQIPVELASILIDDAAAYGIELTTDEARLLLKHLDLVLEKNQELNLTRIIDAEEGVILHLLDSVLLLPFVPDDCTVILDIGTGGGFPGLPLAIITGKACVLLDSSKKKIAAVEGFVHELGLEERVETSSLRAEEYAIANPSSIDCVVARAVADTRVLVEYAAPLLSIGGSLVVAKADPSDDELEAANMTAGVCGMEFVSRETFFLPRDHGKRTIIVYKKTGEPKVTLPRRNGVAVKKPLYK